MYLVERELDEGGGVEGKVEECFIVDNGFNPCVRLELRKKGPHEHRPESLKVRHSQL